MEKKLRIDWLMFAVAAGLAVFGSIMVYSASAMISLRETRRGRREKRSLRIFINSSDLRFWFGGDVRNEQNKLSPLRK
jgi:cell division protein FtsW (lipid II flippase)